MAKTWRIIINIQSDFFWQNKNTLKELSSAKYLLAQIEETNKIRKEKIDRNVAGSLNLEFLSTSSLRTLCSHPKIAHGTSSLMLITRFNFADVLCGVNKLQHLFVPNRNRFLNASGAQRNDADPATGNSEINSVQSSWHYKSSFTLSREDTSFTHNKLYRLCMAPKPWGCFNFSTSQVIF